MQDTAQIKVTMTINLTGEPGIEEQPGVSADQKAEVVEQILRDQAAAIRRTYDTGVEVIGKFNRIDREEETL